MKLSMMTDESTGFQWLPQIQWVAHAALDIQDSWKFHINNLNVNDVCTAAGYMVTMDNPAVILMYL